VVGYGLREPTRFDVAIVGAGPVGLALAIELARADLRVVVLDRRARSTVDTRPQLLVARSGDLANLVRLGLDTTDRHLVSPLYGSPRSVVTERDLWTLVDQPRAALVPIGRLQDALYAQAIVAGATVQHGAEIVRVRRHADEVSLALADGTSLHAGLAIVATGAGRTLVPTDLAQDAWAWASTARRMIGGVFAATAPQASWKREDVVTAGLRVRATVLQTSAATRAGTSILLDPRVDASDDQLARAFDGVARRHGLDRYPTIAAPRVFTTAATALARRVLAGGGRAPLVFAGDAAQTGHVFTGATCFVNLALALELADRLRPVARVLARGDVHAPMVADALARYDARSQIGAAILGARSQAVA
jgi:2-polyprenyl-6-methoxyphenol hydroxylase-like FAD-dependent oxidoreductase